MFFEDSTRTKFSFEVAEKRLGAHVLNFSKESSSMNKGESLYDTLKTFESLGLDIAVIRHSDDHYIESLKDKFKFRVINAGAGKYEHPSQSLLDLFTIKQEFGSFKDLTVTICGDVQTSRVAKSNIAAFQKLGIKTILSGPPMLLPSEDKVPEGCAVMSLDKALPESDVVMLLRIQHERHETFELSTERYNELYGMNESRVQKMKEKAIIMHPGPFNRGVELTDDIVEHEKSRIFKQKANGVFARMAILDWLIS